MLRSTQRIHGWLLDAHSKRIATPMGDSLTLLPPSDGQLPEAAKVSVGTQGDIVLEAVKRGLVLSDTPKTGTTIVAHAGCGDIFNFNDDGRIIHNASGLAVGTNQGDARLQLVDPSVGGAVVCFEFFCHSFSPQSWLKDTPTCAGCNDKIKGKLLMPKKGVECHQCLFSAHTGCISKVAPKCRTLSIHRWFKDVAATIQGVEIPANHHHQQQQQQGQQGHHGDGDDAEWESVSASPVATATLVQKQPFAPTQPTPLPKTGAFNFSIPLFGGGDGGGGGGAGAGGVPQAPLPSSIFPHDIAPLTVELARQALKNHAKTQTGWTEKAALRMNIVSCETALHYRIKVDVFNESRSVVPCVEPFKKGTPIDGRDRGVPPMPWDIRVQLQPPRQVSEAVGGNLRRMGSVESTISGPEDIDPTQIFDVFLSHKQSESQDLAKLLKEVLTTKYGQVCFLDRDCADKLHDLGDIVRRSKNFVFILSDTSLSSEWCLAELRAALAGNVNIILVVQQDSRWGEDRDHKFPIVSTLPEDIRAAFTSKALDHTREYFQAFIEKLTDRLTTELPRNAVALAAEAAAPFYHERPFEDSTKQVKVPHTDEVIGCSNCGMLGNYACTTCSGQGRTQCRLCNGRGSMPARTHQNNGPLQTASCHNCNGQRTTTCSTCKGAKQVVCSQCQGNGQIRKYFGLHCQYKNHAAQTVICSHDCQPVVQILASTPHIPYLTIMTKELDPARVEATIPIPSVRANVNQTIANAVATASDPSARLLQQRISIGMTPVTRVTYQLKQGKEEEYWVIGLDQQQIVYAPTYQKLGLGIGLLGL